MKVYVKANIRGDYHNLNFANAAYGYLEMGFEVIKYSELSEIFNLVTELISARWAQILERKDECLF